MNDLPFEERKALEKLMNTQANWRLQKRILFQANKKYGKIWESHNMDNPIQKNYEANYNFLEPPKN
jgi:hypothetical protein